MLTFKSFLSENSLLDLRLELWLQRRFNLTKEQRLAMAEWFRDDGNIALDGSLFEILLDAYRDHVSYDTIKDGEGEGEFWNRLDAELRVAGIEVHQE